MPTGQTADGTWELGVRRTLPLTREGAWALLTDHPADWLGDPDARLDVGATFAAPDGTSGEVTSVTAGEVARARWRTAPDAPHSILQVRALPTKTGTAIAFHHERLADRAAREHAADRWTAALDRLEDRVSAD